eukprot:gene27635-33373_t
MSAMNNTRIKKETERLLAEPVEGVSATPYEDNPRYFNVAIAGPIDSPYQGGLFRLELFLPAEYPMGPPKVRFLTKIYHPNIDRLGRICLDILKDKWSPALQIRTVLLSIQGLLSAPNPDDPLNNTAADHWKRNEADAVRLAKEWTARRKWPGKGVITSFRSATGGNAEKNNEFPPIIQITNKLQCILTRNVDLGLLQVSFKGPDVPNSEKPFHIDFSSSKRHQDSQPELLVRAVGPRYHTVVDLTVGLGRDALVLCSRGTRVVGVEKCFVLHSLLQDALDRLKVIQPAWASRMTLLYGSSEDMVPDISRIVGGDDDICVYLDPMYPLPPEERTSKSKKDTQILHRLAEKHTPINDERLFASALRVPGVRRVVVKRGLNHPPLISAE